MYIKLRLALLKQMLYSYMYIHTCMYIVRIVRVHVHVYVGAEECKQCELYTHILLHIAHVHIYESQ